MDGGSARELELKIPAGTYWNIIVLRISDTNFWFPVFIMNYIGVPYDGDGGSRVDEEIFVLLGLFTFVSSFRFVICISCIPFRF